MPLSPRPTGRRLLGTAIYELAPPPELLILADLHLRPERGAACEALRAVLEAAPGVPVLILGDLFDFWVGPRQRAAPAWEGLCARLAACFKGRELFFVPGNRDYMLDPRTARALGLGVVPGGLLLRAETPLLCLHGDELCTRDRSYQRAKRLLRSAGVRALLRALPWAVARRLAAGARRASMRATTAALPDSLLPPPEALAEAAAFHAGPLLFGHVHRNASGPLPGGARYYVLPAFDAETAPHARWSPNSAPRLVLSGRESPFGPPLP